MWVQNILLSLIHISLMMYLCGAVQCRSVCSNMYSSNALLYCVVYILIFSVFSLQHIVLQRSMKFCGVIYFYLSMQSPYNTDKDKISSIRGVEWPDICCYRSNHEHVCKHKHNTIMYSMSNSQNTVCFTKLTSPDQLSFLNFRLYLLYYTSPPLHLFNNLLTCCSRAKVGYI